MKKILFLIIVGVGVILTATSIPANALTFGLDVEYSEGTEPQAAQPPPWLTATFEDIEDPVEDIVQLTMTASNLTGSEFVSEWYFNWNFNIADLIPEDIVEYPDPVIYLPPPTSDGPEATFILFDNDDLSAGPASGFDIFFNFPTSNAANRFGTGEKVVYRFIGTGISASAFNSKNTEGDYYSAAHVQAINDTIYPDDDSGWIGATSSTAAIPEPGTFLLLVAGLASLLGIRRFKFKK